MLRLERFSQGEIERFSEIVAQIEAKNFKPTLPPEEAQRAVHVNKRAWKREAGPEGKAAEIVFSWKPEALQTSLNDIRVDMAVDGRLVGVSMSVAGLAKEIGITVPPVRTARQHMPAGSIRTENGAVQVLGVTLN